MPPCPGMTCPVSLVPTLRLRAHSTRSPIWPITPSRMPMTKASREGKGDEGAPDQPRVAQDGHTGAREHARELPVREHAHRHDKDGEGPGGRADDNPHEGGKENGRAEDATSQLPGTRRASCVNRC